MLANQKAERDAQTTEGTSGTPKPAPGSGTSASGAGKKRKQATEQPGRKQPRRGDKAPHKPLPPLRGPPAAKPKRKSMVDELPNSQEKRRKKQRQYSHDSYVKKRDATQAATEADGEADGEAGPSNPWAASKTGKERPGPAAAQRAKSRAVVKFLIGESSLGYLLPPQCRPMTERHKRMCGCETCIEPAQMQRSLNGFRTRWKKKLWALAKEAVGRVAKAKASARARAYQPTLDYVVPSPWHAKPSLAVAEMQCKPVQGVGLPHWRCVLGICDQCPEYPIPDEERGLTDEPGVPKIKFHVGEVHEDPTKLDKNGKPKKYKRLTFREEPIGIFHRDFYLPSIQKLKYHTPHRIVLGKDRCGKQRVEAFLSRIGDAKTRRDYAERLKGIFDLEEQHEHFGNGRTISMEGCALETWRKEAIAEFNRAKAAGCSDDAALLAASQVNADKPTRMAFHSHISDDSRQDAATTHAHMLIMIGFIRTIELLDGHVLWDDTDGCGKQYRCGTALQLLSQIAFSEGITVAKMRRLRKIEYAHDLR